DPRHLHGAEGGLHHRHDRPGAGPKGTAEQPEPPAEEAGCLRRDREADRHGSSARSGEAMSGAMPWTARPGAGCGAHRLVIPTHGGVRLEAIVTVPFCDNLEATPIDGLTCLVEVERVYGLDWDRFGESQWEALARIYKGLPGAVRHLE